MKDITKGWLDYAERDFKLAKELLEDEYYANQSVYHSQQAIEKIIKATLEESKIRFPKIHTVHILFSLLPLEIKNKITIDESELEFVDDVFIESKYPSDLGLLPKGLPSKEDAQQIFTIAEKIYLPLLNFLNNIK